METISFEDLGLDSATLAAIEAKGFETPSPIQVLAIPRLIDGDANVIAKARTGTGKTAAFGLPLVQKIRSDSGFPQALVLTPTRELALQVCKEIESLATGRFPRLTSVYGGQSMSEQLRALKRGTEIVVGTPGRVKDHLERGSLKLENISYFILDEADEMLDMGFIDDIEFIFSKANPKSRILLFSATMPPQILKIASKFMGDYEIVEEEERPEEPLLTEQRYWVVRESEKIEALVRLIDISPDFYGLVFTQTKADADSISRQLDERGYEAAALHGDIAQNQREKILYRFRNKKTRILVATDVAARGIDIEGLTHVVNYALPYDGPTYVHRIGRTGRAGAKGLAFTLVRPEERRRVDYLKQFSKKATLGDLREDTIPSVDQVLAVKRQRLFDEMKTSLGINGQEEGEGADVSAAEPFLSMAEELCASGNATEVLAAVLAQSYGRALDPTRYGDISSMKAQASLGKQVRI
ncbi:MAG TPA: DEAD/DEAH box helicase, partial [Treponemataceae bacterium]|nr:DEAD/DEAH box helicase [Treponemataceae bacterium]